MDNLETSLANTVDKSTGNTDEAIVGRFIKPIASTMFGYLVYSMNGPGPLIEISGPHAEFFNSDFGIWIGVKQIQMDATYKSRQMKHWGACE